LLKDCSSLTTPSKIFFCCKISDRETLKVGLFKAEKQAGADKKSPAAKTEDLWSRKKLSTSGRPLNQLAAKTLFSLPAFLL